MTASILVADDHDIARAGLIAMIGGEDDFHVAWDVRDGVEAVEACTLHKPDLALLDIRMPRLDGLAATREIRRVSPGTRVMIITMHDSLDYLEAAIEWRYGLPAQGRQPGRHSPHDPAGPSG